jgi:hypothetical protein
MMVDFKRRGDNGFFFELQKFALAMSTELLLIKSLHVAAATKHPYNK